MADPMALEVQNAVPHTAEAVGRADRAAQRQAAQRVAADGAVTIPEKGVPAEEATRIKQAEEKQDATQERESLTERQKEALTQSFKDLNRVMTQFNRSIRFSVFEQSGDLYAQVVNTKTDEVVRTIPSEEAMELMARIDEVIGLFVDEQG